MAKAGGRPRSAFDFGDGAIALGHQDGDVLHVAVLGSRHRIKITILSQNAPKKSFFTVVMK
jgi:hypothetical protein